MQDNTSNTNKASIVCKVKKVVFHNKENGYSVLSAISDAEDGQFSLCGILHGKPEGTVLHCQGEWKEHIMYGRQFIVDSWEEGKADEVKKFFSIQSRANSRPVYRTWGEMLKYNLDIAAKVKYVTEVFLTSVEKDFDSSNCYNGWDYTVDVTAYVKAIYYAVYNGQKYALITCTFTVSESFTEDFGSNLTSYQIDSMIDDGGVGDYAQAHSRFYDIDDFNGLDKLDFHASGVPVCEEDMLEDYYAVDIKEDEVENALDEEDVEENIDDKEDMDDEDDEYSIDDMKLDLELAIESALSDAGIDYDDGEYQCTKMFSRHKISGEFF